MNFRIGQKVRLKNYNSLDAFHQEIDKARKKFKASCWKDPGINFIMLEEVQKQKIYTIDWINIKNNTCRLLGNNWLWSLCWLSPSSSVKDKYFRK